MIEAAALHAQLGILAVLKIADIGAEGDAEDFAAEPAPPSQMPLTWTLSVSGTP
jgi:hypothetical protein